MLFNFLSCKVTPLDMLQVGVTWIISTYCNNAKQTLIKTFKYKACARLVYLSLSVYMFYYEVVRICIKINWNLSFSIISNKFQKKRDFCDKKIIGRNKKNCVKLLNKTSSKGSLTFAICLSSVRFVRISLVVSSILVPQFSNRENLAWLNI